MDYVEAFKNLRTNNKYGRKSPHKAVLMLTVIELFEKNILTDKEIYYDEKLKSVFLKVWNRVMPEEPLFHSEAYLPFWYLQNDSFWHIVPIRGKEEILSLMSDTNIKPSEAKLNDSVKYAELDEDLCFLMTLPSGRSSLKRALLETYFSLTEEQIEKLSESSDNSIDYSISALSEYNNILTKKGDEVKSNVAQVDEETILQFNGLNEDLKIALNYEYYSFLKKHRSEREMFKEVCPTVFDLYHNIVNHPIRKEEITPSIAFLYENFLSDLKISLMSEDNATELIEYIEKAIHVLQGNIDVKILDESEYETPIAAQSTYIDETSSEEPNSNDDQFLAVPERDFTVEDRRGKPWTENEEELIALFFNQGRDIATIAEAVGRTEVSIKMRLAKLGLIEYTYGQDDGSTDTGRNDAPSQGVSLDDFTVENSYLRCSLKNRKGDKVFSADGKLKRIGNKLYRLNMKEECFTIKAMKFDGGVWIRGDKKIVAYPNSALYNIMMREVKYEALVEDIIDAPAFFECRVKVSGKWYDNKGEVINEDQESKPSMALRPSYDSISTFVPKGKLKSISEVAEESYDFLLPMAVVEFMQFTPQPTIITFDRLACMMIAVGWEILGDNEEVREKEHALCECIQFLMDESKEEMEDKLTWASTQKEVFNAIKDYPMAGVFEDTVDLLTEDAPYQVLKAWMKVDEKEEIERDSNLPSSTCLYGIHPMKHNPYIEVKQGWMRYLRKEHDSLMNYFKETYLDYWG